MGAMQNNGKGSSKAKQSKASQLALAGFGTSPKDIQAADWGAADPEGLMAVVEKITSLGGAVMFGMSRDGGSLLVTLYLEGDRINQWIPGGDDVNARLYEIFQKLETIS